MRELVASLEPERAGPSALDVPPEDQAAPETPNEPAPDVAPDQVPTVQSSIQSAIRPPTQTEQGQSAVHPLPDTLDSLNGIPISEEVETFNPGVINLEGSPGSPLGASFILVHGTPSPDRAQIVVDAVPVATRSPYSTVRASHIRKADD